MDSNVNPKDFLIVLVKRYLLRMKMIRERRKLVQKLQIIKYKQYLQEREQLFNLFMIKLLQLHHPRLHTKIFGIYPKKAYEFKIPYSRRGFKHENTYWWDKIYPNMTTDEFYYTFHIPYELYQILCNKLYENLKPLTSINKKETTSVDKQIVISLYILAHGNNSYKIRKIFGMIKAIVSKLFNKFLCETINEYNMYMSDTLTYDECYEMNQELLKKTNISNAIGTLVRIKFGDGRQNLPGMLGIVDTNGKFHFVHFLNNSGSSNFYKKLDVLCKENYPRREEDTARNYVIITDEIVPEYDCFLNKSSIELSDKNDINNELLKNINVLLECRKDSIEKLIKRWNILASRIEHKKLFLIIKASIVLHNICQDYLRENNIEYKSFEIDKNMSGIRKEIIDIITREYGDYDDDDDDDDDDDCDNTDDNGNNDDGNVNENVNNYHINDTGVSNEIITDENNVNGEYEVLSEADYMNYEVSENNDNEVHNTYGNINKIEIEEQNEFNTSEINTRNDNNAENENVDNDNTDYIVLEATTERLE